MAIRFNEFFIEKTEFDGYMLDLFLNVSDQLIPELAKSKEYTTARDKYVELLEQIEALLPEDKKHLVSELDNAEGNVCSIHNEGLFIKGLQYGSKLARVLKITDSSKEVFVEDEDEEISIIAEFTETVNDLNSKLAEIEASNTLTEHQKALMKENCLSIIRNIRASQVQSFCEYAVRIPFDFGLLSAEQRGEIVSVMCKDVAEITDAEMYHIFSILDKNENGKGGYDGI